MIRLAVGVGSQIAWHRALALFDLDPEEIDATSRYCALRAALQLLRLLSHHEPGCEVMAALERGEINRHRYESFVRLHEEHTKLADMYWWGIDED